jgi:DNA-binding MarR family transcriptional regulator
VERSVVERSVMGCSSNWWGKCFLQLDCKLNYSTKQLRCQILTMHGVGYPGSVTTERSPQRAQWLDDEEMRAWRGLVEAYADLEAALEADLVSGFGIDGGDYGVLVNLSEAPDQRLRMCDLAARLHLSPSGLTRRLDGLVKAGYVARQPSEQDRRVTLAVLTDEGRATLEAAAPVHVAGVRTNFVDHLSRTQLRQLGAAFEALQRRRGLDAPGTETLETA